MCRYRMEKYLIPHYSYKASNNTKGWGKNFPNKSGSEPRCAVTGISLFADLSELIIPKAPTALIGGVCSQTGFLVDPQLVI